MGNARPASDSFGRRLSGALTVAVEATRMPMIFAEAGDGHPIVFANDAFLRLTAYEHHEIVGRRFDFLSNCGRDELAAVIATDDDVDPEVCCRRRDGSEFWATMLACPVVDDRGTTDFYFASFVDQTRHIEERARILALSADVARKVTELRALQATTVKVSRLTAMGMVGATMAHEINQPLTAITNYLRGARRRLEAARTPLPDGVLDALDQADRGALRASRIIHRVREVSRLPHRIEQPASVRAMVAEACDLALVEAAPGIDLRVDLDGAADVLVNPVAIQQVLVNLLQNAVEAVAGQSRREITVSARAGADQLCEIAIRDTGAGVAPEAMAKLFEPFNSTKVDGVGIGLSISRAIVEAHGGRFWLEASDADGADFRFSLPLAVAPAETGASER